MKFRVEIDLSFEDKKKAQDLLNYIEDLKADTYEPTGKEKIEIPRKVRYHPCRHDENPPVQCGGYVNVDFKQPKKVHNL